ncbi:hypothetical protein [Aliiglaciecola lipolytica]|uniref:PEP-CTERM protein-sorting domain-containing protein n=1 Tax=Aliiglaciecola lipolytica E3 TaxID=1127673 RepID=K6X5B9_9ALTE|nr:hypothetical protein [Aliiglaciecola lipolytica]GAC15794.1 hypothetical protein GLIP_3177 [Aliiglaciecola lipolytica E3]
MKLLRIIIIFGLFQSSAFASLIQWDAFHSGDQLAVKDQDTGTIWLDLSVTAGFSYSQAGDLFTDWGYASNQQVEELLSKAFPNFTSNTISSYQLNCLSGNGCFNQANQWLELFGATEHLQNANVKYGFGLYADEDDVVRMGGSRINGILGSANIYGDEFSVDYSSYLDSPAYFYSTFLTFQPQLLSKSNVALSETGTLGLFALAIGLFGIKRKKR